MSKRSLAPLDRARAAGRLALTEPEAKALLRTLGIAVPRGEVVGDAEAAGAAAGRIDGAVVVKVVSPDLIHKTEVGGVRVGIGSAEEAAAAAREILASVRAARPEARIEGLLVEEQLAGGVECVAGALGSSALGPAVMFGLGGIFVEIFDDVAFRIAPLDEPTALEMLDEVRAARLLRGYRGAPAADLAALARVLVRLGELATSGQVAELDVNPLLALPDRAVALDAVVSLTKGA